MSCEHEAAGLVAFYVAGGLSPDDRRLVEVHLTTCTECRADLETWTSVAASVRQGVPDLLISGQGLQRLSAAVEWSATAAVVRAWDLVRAQAALLGGGLWAASALVMAAGWLAAVMVGSAGALNLVAPLVAAVGLSHVYGPRHDPAFEITMATPTSPRQVLLARVVLVLGYDVALAVVASATLAAVRSTPWSGAIVIGWMAPLMCLSALALLVSIAAGSGAATVLTLILWLLRVLAADRVLAWPWHRVVAGYAAWWQHPVWLSAAAIACLSVSVWLVGRAEGRLPAGSPP